MFSSLTSLDEVYVYCSFSKFSSYWHKGNISIVPYIVEQTTSFPWKHVNFDFPPSFFWVHLVKKDVQSL